jgi:hypothetical protein
MLPPTNNWRKRRTEYHCYAEIVTDITTWNSERKDTYYILIFPIDLTSYLTQLF